MVYPDQSYQWNDHDAAAAAGGGVVWSLIEGTGYDYDDDVGLNIVRGDGRYSGYARYGAVIVGIGSRRNFSALRPSLGPGDGGRGGGGGGTSELEPPPLGGR